MKEGDEEEVSGDHESEGCAEKKVKLANFFSLYSLSSLVFSSEWEFVYFKNIQTCFNIYGTKSLVIFFSIKTLLISLSDEQ